MKNFKELINKIGLHLKPKGFKQKGDSFYVDEYNNWGLINFQKSRSSTSLTTIFTINLGISSSILREYQEIDISKKPTIDECHWHKRIGSLFDKQEDYWWSLDVNTDLEKMSDEIILMLNELVIPEIHTYISDESLESEWLNDRGSGLTDLQIYVNLTTLLKLKGSDKLFQVIESIRKDIDKKSCKTSFEFHIKHLLDSPLAHGVAR